MKSYFSFYRFRLLIHENIREAFLYLPWILVVLTLLSFILGMAITFEYSSPGFVLRTSEYEIISNENNVHRFTFPALCILFHILMASQLWYPFKGREYKMQFIGLPASSTEKWWARFTFGVMITPLLFLGLYLLLFIPALKLPLYLFEKNITIMPFRLDNPLNWLTLVLCSYTQGFLYWWSIRMPRQTIFRGIILLFLLSLFCVLLDTTRRQFFFTDTISFSRPFYLGISFVGAFEALFIGFFILTVPIFWWLSYLELRQQELV